MSAELDGIVVAISNLVFWIDQRILGDSHKKV